MAEALHLAQQGIYTTDPNPRVGCVLVKDGAVLARSWHQRAGEEHAEIQALRLAGGAAKGSTLYINLEPCCFQGRTPACTTALIAAGVSEVHTSMLDPHPRVAGKGLAALRAQGIQVSIGLLADQAKELNKGFIKRWETGLPWVRCKLAMSLNGATGTQPGRKTDLTGMDARADVHKWRARSSAIITTAATLVADDALLNARLEETQVMQPVRIVLDADFSLSPNARFFTQGEKRLWVGAEDSLVPTQLPTHTQICQLPRRRRGLCLPSLLKHLAALEMNEVMVEAGPHLAASFIEEELVNELILYLSPQMLGADPLMSLQLDATTQARQFAWQDVRFFAQDLRLILKPDPQNASP